MATDLTIHLENRVGALAELGQALGNAGVNIEGMAAAADLDEGHMHILVDDEAAAKTALEGAGVHVHGAREVLLLELANEPGELGRAAQKLAAAGVNIDLIYVASGTRLVVGADDMEKARAAV
jgi:hypothetical protein